MPKRKRYINFQKAVQSDNPSRIDPTPQLTPSLENHCLHCLFNQLHNHLPQFNLHNQLHQLNQQMRLNHPQTVSVEKSMRCWSVDAIDSEGSKKKLKLKSKDVLYMSSGDKVIVPFDHQQNLTDEAQALLAGFCGILAPDTSLFPINFDKWCDIPQSYFDHCVDNMIMPLFHFETTVANAKRYLNNSLSKKWAENRQKLWNDFYDPTKSRDELIQNVSEGIGRDQWASFVNYRLNPKTMEMCKRNAENRKKQIVPHTGGVKANSRRRQEMFVATGRIPGRGEIYLATHKKEDGSYVDEDAREVCGYLEKSIPEDYVVWVWLLFPHILDFNSVARVILLQITVLAPPSAMKGIINL